MSRSALLVSLALHAAVLVMVGIWFSSAAARIGPGHAGADASFLADAAGGRLMEIAPAPAAESAPPPQVPEAEFAPSAPILETPVPLVATPTAGSARVPAPAAHLPASAVAKADAAGSARTALRGNRPRGSGAEDAGSGLAETSRSGGGAGYVPPQFLLRYKPPYPDAARAQRLEGTVLLLVSLDAGGRVTAAALQRTCGHGILDRAALAAVRSWRFEPARQNGTAIAAQVEIPIRFRFEERTARRA